MSKISSDIRVPIAHAGKMFKINPQSQHKDGSSALPCISSVKQRRLPQNRMNRLSSSSFLLRLMSIEELQQQDKQKASDSESRYNNNNNSNNNNNNNNNNLETDRGQTDEAAAGDGHRRSRRMRTSTRQASHVVVKDTSFRHGVYSGQMIGNAQNANALSKVAVLSPAKQNNDLHQQQNVPEFPLLSNDINLDKLSQSDESSTTMSQKQIHVLPYDYKNNTTPFSSHDDFDLFNTTDPSSNVPLKLPPLLLPPVHSVRPRPLKQRDFLRPTNIRGPISEKEWDELLQCRYIRHATPRYALKWTPSKSYINYQ